MAIGGLRLAELRWAELNCGLLSRPSAAMRTAGCVLLLCVLLLAEGVAGRSQRPLRRKQTANRPQAQQPDTTGNGDGDVDYGSYEYTDYNGKICE